MEPSMYTIKAILLLDGDGNRIQAKYYDDHFATVKEQRVFEKQLFGKTAKANGEIIMLDHLTIVYRSSIDLFFYVIGSTHNANEIMLVNLLNCFYDTVSLVLRRNVEKKHLIEYMDSVTLIIDEICDSGIMLETDPNAVLQRICFRDTSSGGGAGQDIPLGEQTVFDVIRMARDQIKSSVFK